jgi:hypothetical protein
MNTQPGKIQGKSIFFFEYILIKSSWGKGEHNSYLVCKSIFFELFLVELCEEVRVCLVDNVYFLYIKKKMSDK